MNTKRPFHMLVRFSDNLLKSMDTIDAHTQVIENHGAVWFGKMGSPVSEAKLEELNQQVKDEIPTFIYLIKGNRRKSTAYRGRLIFALRSLPQKEKSMMPEYYLIVDIIRHIKTWFKLSEIQPIDMAELNRLRVIGSVLPIQETLVKSSTGHFFVREN